MSQHVGAFGRAVLMDVPDRPDAAATVCVWLVDRPDAHPLWTQYAILVLRLRDDIPGMPAPKLHHPGMTHEFLVLALDPDQRVDRRWFVVTSRTLPFLTPVNICEQFEATDEELCQLAELAARGVVHGLLWPETADAPDVVRHQWKTALVKTLAHIRGEEHAP